MLPPPFSSSVCAIISVGTCLLIAVLCNSPVNAEKSFGSMRLLAEWKVIEYEFPSDQLRQAAIDEEEYVPGNGVAIDVDVDYGTNASRVFVTVPRFNTGIPITLGTLTKNKGTGGPQIRGYPNYEWNANQGRNCDGLTSVYRVAIDDCRRLWVLDAGRLGNDQVCPPQLVVFNLDTDQVVHRYKFPASQYRPGSSLFITPVVDVRDPTPGTPTTCPNTMVYIADDSAFSLIMFDLKQNSSWMARNKYAYPTPQAGTFEIAGETFDLMDGIFGLALSPQPRSSHGPHSPPSQYHRHQQPSAAANGERVLYFHTLSSYAEVTVPLRVLDNSSIWEEWEESEPRAFVEIGSRGTQSPAQAMDANGNLFFGLIDPIGIGCWDTQRPYRQDEMRVVAKNNKTLQFSSGLKVKRNRSGKNELWTMTNRFQKVMTGSMSPDEVNYRIQVADIEQLLGGQKRCSPSRRYSGY